jgi:hypothetical protein
MIGTKIAQEGQNIHRDGKKNTLFVNKKLIIVFQGIDISVIEYS